MKRFILIAAVTALVLTAYYKGRQQAETFFDGEGNAIPNEAVHLLVKKQFVYLDSAETKKVDYFFYH